MKAAPVESCIGCPKEWDSEQEQFCPFSKNDLPGPSCPLPDVPDEREVKNYREMMNYAGELIKFLKALRRVK